MDALHLANTQLGDLSTKDVAAGDISTIYNIASSLEQVTTMLRDDLRILSTRVQDMEHSDEAHADERSAMTRIIMLLSHENRTVKDMQGMIERQIVSESTQRSQRQRYLDSMLISLIVLAVANTLLNLYRVFRGAGRPA